MKPSFNPHLPLTFASLTSLALMSTTVFAHPGHEEDAPRDNAPAFFLAQAGPPGGAPPSAAAFGTARNEVSITVEGEFRVIKANGWPDHAPGTFPRRGNPNTLAPQSYTFRVPMKPKLEDLPVRRGGWWWGVALNGVPFEPGTGETWNNDPQSGWRYEAATGFLDLGLDEHNAHVQPTGAYHYHALPTGLVERLGGDENAMLLIGWAADGFPLYTTFAHADAKDAKSALRKMKPSYRVRKGARPAQEGGPGGSYDGRFTQDFEFVKDSGDLDECNGRTGVTPEFPEGTYYYCISAEFPFVPRTWRGQPDQSFSKGDRPPGGGPGRGPRPAPFGGAPRGILEGGSNLPVLNALDLNKDGALDSDEMAKAAASLKALDKNDDGKLTPDEYRAAPPGGGSPGSGGPPDRPPTGR